MNLTRNQFDVLSFLEHKKTNPATLPELAKETGLSPETLNTVIAQLRDSGFLDNLFIRAQGLEALEPYRVQRAIFIAAGFGSRLVPITLNTPKPLVRVHGVRIIDTMLDALIATGIQDITIVRGYLWEQFDQLLYKYPDIKFIENQSYNDSNNISSAMCVRDKIKNAYILEGDLVLHNPRLITKYQYTSNYLGAPVVETSDWCLETRDNIITKMKIGGKKCHLMFGLSYWNNQDGTKLAEHIKQIFESKNGKEYYWDQVALEHFINEYRISVRECSLDDICEIDTFAELQRLDRSYLI
jgi:CTP:phosphocholine cytidylyltransferase-like protein